MFHPAKPNSDSNFPSLHVTMVLGVGNEGSVLQHRTQITKAKHEPQSSNIFIYKIYSFTETASLYTHKLYNYTEQCKRC